MEKPGNPLEQFVLLGKTACGVAVTELISQALDMAGVYVFGELLDLPNIQALSEGQYSSHLQLLNLFAYGTYSDYKANHATLPALTPAQAKKLRHLSIVSMATKNKCIPYAELLTELEMKNVRELEDLIIEAIYADVIRGKLDQQHQQLEVDYTIGRDIRTDAVDEISRVLQDWCEGCEAVLQGIEAQVNKANQRKDHSIKINHQIEQEVTNIKKTLKSTSQQEAEEQMVTDSRDTAADKPVKKSSKTKGLRGSGKLWGKGN